MIIKYALLLIQFKYKKIYNKMLLEKLLMLSLLTLLMLNQTLLY